MEAPDGRDRRDVVPSPRRRGSRAVVRLGERAAGGARATAGRVAGGPGVVVRDGRPRRARARAAAVLPWLLRGTGRAPPRRGPAPVPRRGGGASRAGFDPAH